MKFEGKCHTVRVRLITNTFKWKFRTNKIQMFMYSWRVFNLNLKTLENNTTAFNIKRNTHYLKICQKPAIRTPCLTSSFELFFIRHLLYFYMFSYPKSWLDIVLFVKNLINKIVLPPNVLIKIRCIPATFY